MDSKAETLQLRFKGQNRPPSFLDRLKRLITPKPPKPIQPDEAQEAPETKKAPGVPESKEPRPSAKESFTEAIEAWITLGRNDVAQAIDNMAVKLDEWCENVDDGNRLQAYLEACWQVELAIRPDIEVNGRSYRIQKPLNIGHEADLGLGRYLSCIDEKGQEVTLFLSRKLPVAQRAVQTSVKLLEDLHQDDSVTDYMIPEVLQSGNSNSEEAVIVYKPLKGEPLSRLEGTSKIGKHDLIHLIDQYATLLQTVHEKGYALGAKGLDDFYWDTQDRHLVLSAGWERVIQQATPAQQQADFRTLAEVVIRFAHEFWHDINPAVEMRTRPVDFFARVIGSYFPDGRDGRELFLELFTRLISIPEADGYRNASELVDDIKEIKRDEIGWVNTKLEERDNKKNLHSQIWGFVRARDEHHAKEILQENVVKADSLNADEARFLRFGSYLITSLRALSDEAFSQNGYLMRANERKLINTAIFRYSGEERLPSHDSDFEQRRKRRGVFESIELGDYAWARQLITNTLEAILIEKSEGSYENRIGQMVDAVVLGEREKTEEYKSEVETLIDTHHVASKQEAERKIELLKRLLGDNGILIPLLSEIGYYESCNRITNKLNMIMLGRGEEIEASLAEELARAADMSEKTSYITDDEEIRRSGQIPLNELFSIVRSFDSANRIVQNTIHSVDSNPEMIALVEGKIEQSLQQIINLYTELPDYVTSMGKRLLKRCYLDLISRSQFLQSIKGWEGYFPSPKLLTEI